MHILQKFNHKYFNKIRQRFVTSLSQTSYLIKPNSGEEMKFIYSLLAILTISMSLAAQINSVKEPLVAVRLTELVTVDGNLDETAWKRTGFSDFTQRDPDQGANPTEKTEVWISYDDDAIYIAAYMHDSDPGSITQILSRRDNITNADWFSVYLDPYHDKKTGFFFAVGASGTIVDGILYNDDWNDTNWNGIWEGKSQILADGWSVEMRIPFSQLRFQDAKEYVMGINFERDIARNNEQDYLVYTPRKESGFVSRFPDLTGISNINTKRKIEVLPYVASKAEFLSHQKGDPYNDGSLYSTEVGADIKVGIGSNLTLDATVNPDFGQVEVDPAVVNLTDVESYFDEKRPFFVEGFNIFDNFGRGGSNSFWNFNFPYIGHFYTRRIGRAPQGDLPNNEFSSTPIGTRILGAGKLTGKIFDDVTIGTVHAVTNKEIGKFKYLNESESLRDSSVTIEPYTYYGVLRAQKDFNDGRSGIGFLSTLTTREFDRDELKDQMNSLSSFNGIDGYTFLDDEKEWVITGWTGFTHVSGNKNHILNLQTNSTHYFQRPDAENVSVDSSATSLTGFAGRVYLNKQKGNIFSNTGFGFISPGFEINDAGYNTRTNVINGHHVTGYKWTEPTDYYRNARISLAGGMSSDYDGNIIWAGVFSNGYLQLNNYYELFYSLSFNPETKNITRTRGGPLTLNPVNIELYLGATSDSREEFVADASFSVNSGKSGRGFYLDAGVDWKPSDNVSVRIGPSYSNSSDNDMYFAKVNDPNAIWTYGKHYMFSNFDYEQFSATIRLNWTFTPELSLEVFMQPLIANGKYSNIKGLAKPGSYEFFSYGTNGTTASYSGDSIVVDVDGAGPIEKIYFRDTHFSTKSIIGNAVMRWEFLPGSTFYFVWTQSRSHYGVDSAFNLGQGVKDLILSSPENVFIVKMSYWLPI